MIKYWMLCLFVFVTLSGEAQSDTSKIETKKVGWAAVPAPSYNQVQGFGITVIAGVFYPLSKKDTISNPSSTFLYGTYMENKTWIGAFLTEGYFKENKWWYDLLGVKGDFKFKYYQPVLNQELTINYATDITIVKFNFLRELYNGIYGGVHYKISQFNTTFSLENKPLDLDLPPFSTESKYSGIGVKVAFDDRDYSLNPSTGRLTDITTTHFRTGIGSDGDFDLYEINYNHYFFINPKSVFATRFYGFIGVGDVPFEEQAILGFAGPRGKDLRGYSSGRNRGNQLYDLQAEWRWNFYNKWGMVAFGGLALIGNDSEEIFDTGVLPAIGTGLRFRAAETQKVNIGIDVALGKEDYGIYFNVSEAF